MQSTWVYMEICCLGFIYMYKRFYPDNIVLLSPPPPPTFRFNTITQYLIQTIDEIELREIIKLIVLLNKRFNIYNLHINNDSNKFRSWKK